MIGGKIHMMAKTNSREGGGGVSTTSMPLIAGVGQMKLETTP